MTTVIHSARKLDAHGEVDSFWMLFDGDTIVSTGHGTHPDATTVVDAAGAWLVPGFIDLHGHGGGGFSFDDGPDSILAALALHRSRGTTRSVISLVANPLATLRTSLATIADLADSDPLILGSHLEGPYLAEKRRGAHNSDFLRAPSASEVEELIGAARGTLRQMTIAPELPNALEIIDVLVEAGVIAAIGHTDVTYEGAREAFDRGARILTHAFNAMPGIHHRTPGPIVAAFEDERITLELIMDGKHVHPRVVHLAFGAAPGRIAFVTDAMAAAGYTDGDYSLGTLTVAVRDGLALLRGTTTIAGSTVTHDSALRQAMRDVKIPPSEAIAALTLTPARTLGLEHRHGLLAPGF
ncbi:MAG: N-acetylglucosamine-6-phosphate deacetylase, partial [Rhodoglobus sp.]|nr:N-acetylglucosamine-6-phosphate deacetylase [Rhodoglobus sp.]